MVDRQAKSQVVVSASTQAPGEAATGDADSGLAHFLCLNNLKVCDRCGNAAVPEAHRDAWSSFKPKSPSFLRGNVKPKPSCVALVNRERRAQCRPPVNPKRAYRLMAAAKLLLHGDDHQSD